VGVHANIASVGVESDVTVSATLATSFTVTTYEFVSHITDLAVFSDWGLAVVGLELASLNIFDSCQPVGGDTVGTNTSTIGTDSTVGDLIGTSWASLTISVTALSTLLANAIGLIAHSAAISITGSTSTTVDPEAALAQSTVASSSVTLGTVGILRGTGRANASGTLVETSLTGLASSSSVTSGAASGQN